MAGSESDGKLTSALPRREQNSREGPRAGQDEPLEQAPEDEHLTDWDAGRPTELRRPSDRDGDFCGFRHFQFSG
jgi:hypothetical protein